MSKKFSDFTLREKTNNLQIIGYDPNSIQEIRIPVDALISPEDMIAIHNSDNTAHSDIRTRLENCATTGSINDLVENMNSILGHINGDLDNWSARLDWWNIEQIFQNDSDPNKRFIMLVTDGNNSITLNGNILGNSTAYFKTSDGKTYNTANVIHTWDREQDKPCTAGYKTRYVIVYSNDNNVNCNLSTIDLKYIYFGNNCFIQYLKTYDSQTNKVNKILESIKMDDTVTASSAAIGNNAFPSCYSLRSITIPNGVTHIGDYAFSRCYSLVSITIPNSVTTIGVYAFYFCNSLVFITLPESVKNIGAYAFGECFSLSSIIIPNGVASVEEYTFLDCLSLNSITLPNSVKNITNYAFDLCTTLSSVTIPNSVINMGIYALFTCISLLSINIENGWIAPNFNVSQSQLSVSSILNMFHKLGITPTTRTIILGGTNLAKLTTMEKAIATTKGYTLA